MIHSDDDQSDGSFGGSFDVSAIDHCTDDDEHDHTHHDDTHASGADPHAATSTPAAGSAWFDDPSVSYDSFVQQQMGMRAATAAAPLAPAPMQMATAPAMTAAAPVASLPLAPVHALAAPLAIERREANSATTTGADSPAVASAPTAAAAPISIPHRSPIAPFIPKLALGMIGQQTAATPSVSAAPSMHPSSARPMSAAGASTTRSRLSAFNLKLRAARRIQAWIRNMQACKPAKMEARARRTERSAMQRAEAAVSAQPATAETDAPPRRLLFDENGPAVALPSRSADEKKHTLAHLKQKLAARSSGGGAATARPATATTSNPTSPQPVVAGFSRATASSMTRTQSRSPSPQLRTPGSGARARSARPSLNHAAAPLERMRSFPPHAVPALRATLQGFLVRHILAQRPAQEVIAQIRDVEALIEQLQRERVAGGRYDIQFHRGLLSQRSTLKEKLVALLEPQQQPPPGAFSPSPSRVKFERRMMSPRSEHQQYLAAQESDAVRAGLKRKTVRRFLKRKDEPAMSRPATAAASSSSVPPAHHGDDDSWDGADRESRDESMSGAQSARTFLKRKSKKMGGQKLDWSAVRPRVDDKIGGGYRGPSNAIYESATGREWDERDREQALGGQALPPPPQQQRSVRPKRGLQTARERSSSNPVRRAAFKPSGNAAGVLPLVANTDSAVPPLSPIASARTAKKSRHIILAAKKLDLSRVRARVDDSSPYKAAAAAAGHDDSEDEHGSFDAWVRGGSASPTRLARKKSAGGNLNFSPTRASHSSDSLTARAQQARAQPIRSGVTPNRDELRRLDEELRREQAELAAEAEAWNAHGVGARLENPPSLQPLPSAPPPARAAPPVVRLQLDLAMLRNQGIGGAVPPAATARPASAIDRPFQPLAAADNSVSVSPPSAQMAGGRIRSSRARLSEQDVQINAEIEDIERSLSSMSAFAQPRGAQARAAAHAHAHAHAHAQAQAQGGVTDRAARHRPHTAAAGLHSFAAGMDAAAAAPSISTHDDDLPSEWKRTVPPSEASIPLYAAPTHPPSSPMRAMQSQRQRPASAFSPSGAHSYVGGGSSVGSESVMGLTQAYDELASEVVNFMTKKPAAVHHA